MAKKIRITRAYARMLAEKAMELANMALAGIVFVQFLPEAPFKGSVAFLGFLIFVTLHLGAYFLMRGGERR
jgi:hypothetical protein